MIFGEHYFIALFRMPSAHSLTNSINSLISTNCLWVLGAVSGAGDAGMSNTDQVSSPWSLLSGEMGLSIGAIREVGTDISRMLTSDKCYDNHCLHNTALHVGACKV